MILAPFFKDFRAKAYSTISDSSLGHLAFHGSFSPSKTANQSLPVYEKRKFPSKTGRLLQELYKITK